MGHELKIERPINPLILKKWILFYGKRKIELKNSKKRPQN